MCQTVKNLIKTKHCQYLLKIKHFLCHNSKLFWSYHKAISHHRSTQNPVISHKDTVAKTPSQKAEFFNTYFASVFKISSPKQSSVLNATPLRTDLQLSEMTFSEEDILNYLGNPDVSKSSGPDGILPRLLKECREQITSSLCKLFNISLSTGCVPSAWKSAHMTPIHKKDSKEPAMNYKPISLLPIISKVLEQCAFARFYDHVLTSST